MRAHNYRFGVVEIRAYLSVYFAPAMKPTTLFCLTLALTLLGGAASAQSYLRKANKLYELGEYREAIPGLERYLKKRPDDVATLAKLAQAQRLTGRAGAAGQTLAALTQLSDDPAHAYLQALNLVEAGEYAQSLVPLSRAASGGDPRATALAERVAYAQAEQNKQSGWRVSNEFANSPYDDYGPAVFGEYVVYASGRAGGTPKLYLSGRDGNEFLKVPRGLHKVLAEAANDGPVAYSPSGQLVAYTRNNFQDGEKFTPEAGWELSLVLGAANAEGDFQQGKPFVHNGPGYNTGFASFSADGKRLYFASDRPGGEGGYDLYYSDRTAAGWGQPVNMGPKVNSPGNEITPSANGTALYFASDYLPGYGGFDVYRADLIGDEVSGVVNLGTGVNGPGDDAGFTTAGVGQLAYFFSSRSGGKGGLDLYRGVRNGRALTIAVVDGKSREPISMALLDFSDCGQGNFLTGVDGEYTFRAVETMNCRPSVRKSGYNAKEFTVNLAALKNKSRLEVVLNPEDRMTIYEGKVLHSRTGDVLRDVLIRAKQADSDYVYETRSDAKGRYELKLERQREYLISYEAPGMADIDREVSTYDADGAGILSSFAMFPDANAVAATPAGAYPTAPGERVTGNEPPRRTRPGSVQTGFAVQVAAIDQNATDISAYRERLAQIGQVYGKRENGVLRVRVGP